MNGARFVTSESEDPILRKILGFVLALVIGPRCPLTVGFVPVPRQGLLIESENKDFSIVRTADDALRDDRRLWEDIFHRKMFTAVIPAVKSNDVWH